MLTVTTTDIARELWLVRRALGLSVTSFADRLRIIGRPIDLGMAELRCEFLLASTTAANDEAPASPVQA
ncbi:hypothetical protein [Aquabacterium sp. OR-4]|uniref:hypothetical protein n=1 Tax=Aquabacterium sp. OR-4 TaxID=2978127 RepID=UPI0021B4BD16|nr:hypothetical protein [Aquabacterium sp. OR-4]MDT7834986.1 hypothetical protein [Aquabacterium sp. OR-4]